MSQIKLGLVGKGQSGKSFVATVLRNEHKFDKMSLQDPAKSIARRLWVYGKGQRVNWERRYKIYDAMYKLDSDVWVRYLLNRVPKTPRDIVVDDIRYINELEMLRASGFIIVRIVRPEALRKGHIKIMDAAPGTLILHEWFNKDFTDLIRADYTITNDTRDATIKSIDVLVDKLRNP